MRTRTHEHHLAPLFFFRAARCAEFDDGDVKELSFKKLRLRGGKSFANQHTINDMPFQDPAKFVAPIKPSAYASAGAGNDDGSESESVSSVATPSAVAYVPMFLSMPFICMGALWDLVRRTSPAVTYVRMCPRWLSFSAVPATCASCAAQ